MLQKAKDGVSGCEVWTRDVTVAARAHLHLRRPWPPSLPATLHKATQMQIIKLCVITNHQLTTMKAGTCEASDGLGALHEMDTEVQLVSVVGPETLDWMQS